MLIGGLWEDATAIDEVIPEAALPAFSLEVWSAPYNIPFKT